MEPIEKHAKTSKEAIIHDVASILEDMSKSLTSIGTSQGMLLHANRVVASYCQSLPGSDIPEKDELRDKTVAKLVPYDISRKSDTSEEG